MIYILAVTDTQYLESTNGKITFDKATTVQAMEITSRYANRVGWGVAEVVETVAEVLEAADADAIYGSDHEFIGDVWCRVYGNIYVP